MPNAKCGAVSMLMAVRATTPEKPVWTWRMRLGDHTIMHLHIR
jgi:hypothetical protein